MKKERRGHRMAGEYKTRNDSDAHGKMPARAWRVKHRDSCVVSIVHA
jgi:hypothetical protein